MKKITLILATLSFLLSACGGTPAEDAPPVLTGEDVQATALAMAWTMAAETIAAMPTATPVPPTETPTPVPPTATMTLVPTLALPEITNTPDTDRCNQFLGSWAGTESTMRIVNTTKSTANISLYLSPNNAHNQCGYLFVPSLEKNQSVVMSVPYGTFSMYAWLVGQNKSVSGGGYGIGNPDKHTLEIRDDSIKWITP
ncbi:MAG: hypothetical protein ISR59_02045 [Anaerolineales bacterium]|uniref:Lipoprotein n=1 Tax=Candidatus Desulfolinea nitratireducens TaxID=2841698 RepID=A0A8J6NGS5_9CHLR|nr:hypothetical protein [Candidatus Desulfolinea nitratireducens]MBL6959862.1 hypothetical protein [Anaerolineales bacterium]